MKITIFSIFACIILFDGLQGDQSENSSALTEIKQTNDKEENKEQVKSIPNDFSKKVQKLTDTLKLMQEKVEVKKDQPDSSPYEEIFVEKGKEESQNEPKPKSLKITSALMDLLVAHKERNVKKWNSDETDDNILASEKYKKGMNLLNASASYKPEGYTLMLEASVEGHKEAKAEVAWGLLFGVHMPQNIDLAKDIFEELADEGEPAGHTGLAFLYAIGLGVAFDLQRSLIHFTIAALGGSPWARMALGYRYLHGLTVSSSCEKALLYYRLVADSVVADYQPFGGATVQRISIVEEFDNPNYQPGRIGNDLKDYYEMQAENGEVPAQVGLGQLYYRGSRGVARDARKSLRYFLLAAANGNPLAIAFVGRLYLEGGGDIQIDLPKAYIYLKKSADLGNAAGEAGLGMMYLQGKHVKKDYKKALYYFSKSANRGWVEGIVELGKMHYSGLGTAKNVYLAKRYFMNAAQAGNIISYYYLGQIFADGIGTMRSCMTAVELFKGVSERGKWGSLFMDAYEQYKDKRYNEAFVIYAVLAEMGYMVGQSNAAFILDEKPVDLPLRHRHFQNASFDQEWIRYRKALQFWSRSALQGYHKAVLKIGDHHYYGQGTDVDYEVASIYYKYCADNFNNAQALFNLGYMHEHGLGCTRDTHLARRCYDLAMEISDEAWIPVGLALVKLNIVEVCSSLTSKDWGQKLQLKGFDDRFGPYWDICTIITLTCLIARIIYRRIVQRELFADILNLPIFA